jgi:hypothetical protein
LVVFLLGLCVVCAALRRFSQDVCITVTPHTQVATDALQAMEEAMARDKLVTNDRQLACARINSKVRVPYLMRVVVICLSGL